MKYCCCSPRASGLDASWLASESSSCQRSNEAPPKADGRSDQVRSFVERGFESRDIKLFRQYTFLRTTRDDLR